MIKNSDLVTRFIREKWRSVGEHAIRATADHVIDKSNAFKTGGGNTKIQGTAEFLITHFKKLDMPGDWTFVEIRMKKTCVLIYKCSEEKALLLVKTGLVLES